MKNLNSSRIAVTKTVSVLLVIIIVVAVAVGAVAVNQLSIPDTSTSPTPSPVPTSTPVPNNNSSSTNNTNTPSPTTQNTSTPQPTISPAGMILSHTSSVNSIGYYTVVGEVKNTLYSNINHVKINATFYDSSNTVIGTGFTYTDMSILVPNQKSPFVLSTFPDKIIPTSYNLTVDYSITANQPFQGLTISSNTSSTDILGYCTIVGEVQNNGARTSTDVKVVCTFYNGTGTVIGKTFTYTDPSTVPKGSTASFEISSALQNIIPASYSLQVEGN